MVTPKRRLEAASLRWSPSNIDNPSAQRGSVPKSPSVVSEATAEEKLVASSESAAVAFDTTT